MNILIPDSWLREYVKTKATAKQIKEYLSLCGPSVERIRQVDKETIYDIEVTGNRPDSMSVAGIAREAAAILPRFKIAAKLTHDPYELDCKTFIKNHQKEGTHKLAITTDERLNPRWTSIVITNVKVGPSPGWLAKRLEQTGIRPLNNVVDVTNYLMRAYGQPAHAFDYDAVGKKHGVTTMILRASKKGEKLVTLDGKTHTLPGGDIVIEDGEGTLIDLCGIMGGENSSIKNSTTTVILFMQTYSPAYIRRTSMALAHRTEAAGLFEKGIDSELVLPAIMTGVDMMEKFAGGKVGSKLYDIYPTPYKPNDVGVTKEKLFSYVGSNLDDKTITNILKPLGFNTRITAKEVRVTVPSFRRDIEIDVDVIEEIARIYGYHEIKTKMPETEPPMTIPDHQLYWENDIKIRLRDWGYTELYTYSMISEKLMDVFGLDKQKAYKIANPLSEEWVYMRPVPWPGFLAAVKENLNYKDQLQLFELASTYRWREGGLPLEYNVLVVAWTGQKFREAKGLAQAIFDCFGIPFPAPDSHQPLHWYDPVLRLSLGTYGSMGIVNTAIGYALGINSNITMLDLHFPELVANAHPTRKYVPIPKYPPAVEDLAFIVQPDFAVGPLIDALGKAHRLVHRVTLLDAHEQTRTLHVEYQDSTKNLTAEEIRPIREKLIETATKKFNVHLKSA